MTQIHTCLNCSAEIRTGPFCEQCGQRNVHARLTFRDLLDDVRVQLLEWNLPWLFTIRAMLLRPGTVCREYMDGKRVRYVNPLKYLVYMAAVALLLLQALPERYGANAWAEILGVSDDAPISGAVVQSLVLRIALFAPLIAALFRLVYSRAKFNNTEVSCFIVYALGNGILVGTLVHLAVEAFGDFILDIPMLRTNAYVELTAYKVLLMLAGIFIHTTYAASAFFAEAWYLSWIKVFAVSLVYSSVSVIVTATISDSVSSTGEASIDRPEFASPLALGVPWSFSEQSILAGMNKPGDDFWGSTNAGYGQFLLASGRTDDALYYLLRAAAVQTTDSLSDRYTRGRLANAYLRRGQSDFALSLLDTADVYTEESLRIETALSRGQPADVLAHADLVPAVSEFNRQLAQLWSAGDVPAALTRIRIAGGTPDVDTQQIAFGARWAARLGDPALAWFMFEKLKEDQWDLLWDSMWMPYFSEVRKLPQFKEFVHTQGLEQYWRESGNWADQCRPVGDNDFECF